MRLFGVDLYFLRQLPPQVRTWRALVADGESVGRKELVMMLGMWSSVRDRHATFSREDTTYAILPLTDLRCSHGLTFNFSAQN